MQRSFLKVAAMASTMQLTAIIEREGAEYVSICPELDIASQGATIEKACDNLQEAIELFFLTADSSEIATRLHDEVFVTRLEVAVGRDLYRLLGDPRFRSGRQRGRHAVMQKRTAGTTVTGPVPLHDEMRIGTLQSIVRQSGLPKSLG